MEIDQMTPSALLAAIKGNNAARIDNMSRAVRTRSRKVFEQCKATRLSLDAESDRLMARYNALKAAGAIS